MKKTMLFLFTAFSIHHTIAQKHVGINTSTPLATLHVADSSVLFSAAGDIPANPHNVPINGAGRRMMWYPDKAAFRVGYAVANEWDSINVGNYSFAAGKGSNAIGNSSFAYGDGAIAIGDNAVAIGRKTLAATSGFAVGDSSRATGQYATAAGLSTKASGNYSIAMGNNTTASGFSSTAFGSATTASGNYSTALGAFTTASASNATAMGNNTNASANFSTAMGDATTASGPGSTAMGISTTASGAGSTSMGYEITASGDYAVAMGFRTTASGFNSTAIGVQASTNGHANSVCIGGVSNNLQAPLTQNTVDNQMMMRFDNYTFWVSSTNFAYLIPASNGWAYTSDISKKERFEELNGETVLKKISTIPFYSWNFKAADVRQYRHYGIMAQDFYNAFGKDSYGVIGNDTTVSPLDLLGVAYSGIKALEKRSAAMAKENEQLKADNTSLEKKLLEMQNQIDRKLELLELKINKPAAAKEKGTAGKKRP